MVTRPELAGLEALKQQALQKNRMMNPEERDRIGSLGKPKTLLDLFETYQTQQEVNPEQTFGTDAFYNAAKLFTETPGADFSLLGRMKPEGDNLQEEVQNMSTQLFDTLLKQGRFGEAGKKILDKIYSTGPEYTFKDAYDERMNLIDGFKQATLGPYGSIDSFLKAQRLTETERQEYGERFATSDLSSLGTGLLFMDKTQTGVPFFTDESSPIDMPSYRQQIEKDFGKTQGNILLGEDSTLYTEYESKEQALADSDFLSRAKDVKNTTDRYSPGMQMNVGGVVGKEGFEKDGKFYVPIVTLDEEQKAFVTNIISREDDLNIAGQALGLAEIAATPVQGLYRGVFMAFGKSIDVAFSEGGKLTAQSLKALEKLGTSPGKIKQIENNAKLRIMYSKATKKSITKPATKGDTFRGFEKNTSGRNINDREKYIVGNRPTTERRRGGNVLATKEQIKEAQKMFKEGATLGNISKKMGLNEDATRFIIGSDKAREAENVKKRTQALSFIGTKEKNLIEKIKKGEVYNLQPKQIKVISEGYDNLENLSTNELRGFTSAVKNAIEMNKKAKGLYDTPNLLKLLEDNGIAINRNDLVIEYGNTPLAFELNKILKVKKMPRATTDPRYKRKEYYFYKKPTNLELEKIKKIVEDTRRPTIQLKTAQNVLDFLDNPTVLSYLNKSELPPLKVMMEQFPKLKPDQISEAMIQLINRLDNSKPFRIPDGGGALTQGFLKIRKNAKKAQKLIEQMHGSGKNVTGKRQQFDAYKTAHYRLMAQKLDKSVNRSKGYLSSLRREGREVLRKYGFTNSEGKLTVDIHEPASITAAARADIPSFANFVVIQTPELNRVTIRQTQGKLSTALQKIINNPKSFNKEMDSYNAYVNRKIKENPKLKGQLVFIRKADDVKNQFTPERLNELRDKYGMNLVAEAKAAGFSLEMPKNAIPIEELISETPEAIKMIKGFKGMAMGGTPISREKFQTPGFTNDSEEERLQKLLDVDGVPGTIANSIKRSIEPVQDQIRGAYEKKLEPYFEPILERGIIKQNELEAELANRLNPPRPVKFKFSELPRLVTQSPLLKNMTTDPKVAGLEAMEFIYNSIRPGVENDIQMEEFFPNLYAINQLIQTKGVQPTPKEQDYISAIDEINRALETGTRNFAFNVGDLLFSVPDAILPTGFTDELKRRYEDTDLSRPETFVGEIGALAVEFGVPSSIAYKLINRFRKFTAAQTGGKVNLFAQQTYGLEGLPKLGVQISNVFKKAGTGAISFGAGDFIAGGPYNIVSEMFDDPLLSSQLVGEYVDTSNLSGKDRVIENFKNRLRFGAEGAMIGGVFPLVGPALGKIGKNVLLKPALFLGGGALKIADTVAIKPVTYLASLDPVVLPGLAQGAGAFAKFLGQDVLARLAATAATGGKAFLPSLRGNYGQLPEFSKWRMFDVTSDDPLEAGLKSVDNFLKWFRDSGNQALYAFNLSGGAERFIKSKAREIEKYLEAIERKAYDLANGFLKRYETGFTSPAGEKNMLDQIHEYLRGNLKLSKIEPELQELAKALKDEFSAIKQAYFKELPEGSGLRAFLETNLDKYMRMSFATFTNPNYTPSAVLLDDATKFMENIIRQNEDFLEAAIRGVDPVNQAEAITKFARKNVENIIQIGKREGIDPINALNKINREIIRGDEVFLKTGEELPQVIRNLLGQEKNLRAAVSMTAGSLVSQTANMRAFKEFARHGLENGYLFTSRAEALAAGITDPSAIRSLPGLGPAQELMSAGNGGPIGLFASREMRQTIEGTGGMLDSLLQNSAYQSLIAYKAAVQTGKTVFSPATQTRNFGSASWFPAHVGHIGGGSSVTDAFKIVMDDIFGAGRNVNEVDLIKRIQRKVELGVLDENIVASELGAILKDIKAGKLQSLGQLAQRAENTKFYKQATRVYAGGDNVWKWYGHEYYMSQLKGAFKNIDDIKRFFEDIHGIEYSTKNIMTGATKTLDEGIEEAAAFLLRETYPTYSKVPEFIKAIRKLPIGNFVSFTSEILRTGFATSSVAMKHIASDNRALREMGYRMLTGQAITLGGMTAGAVGLGHALTNVSPTQIEVYKQYFAPDYMKYSTLIPISNHKDGTFKVFDLSRYNPYDIIVSSAKELIKVADKKNYSRDLAALKEQLNNLDPSSAEALEIRKQMKDLGIRMRMSQRLDPDKIQTSTLKQYLNAVGPLYDAVTGTFFGIPIGAEAFVEAATGRTRQGSPIWSKGMTDTEIFDRAMGHFFKTIEPGIVSSGRKLFYSLRGDVSGVGQPLEVNTEIFKLMGGSNVTVDVLGSLDFKISEFQKSFREPKVGKDYYTTENFRSRGPDQLVREYKEQNEQAFRAQYDFYKAAMAAIDSGLITRTQVIAALTNRISPGSKTVPEKVRALMDGRYTAITYGPEGLKSRREKILRNNPGLDTGRYSIQYFLPFGALENEKSFWNFKRFEDLERALEPPREERQSKTLLKPPVERTVAEPEVPELEDSGDPVVGAQAPDINPATGLTTTETALLSPGEQAIRQRQKGIA